MLIDSIACYSFGLATYIESNLGLGLLFSLMMFFRCCCRTKASCCVFKVQFSLHSHSTLSYLILNRSFKILYLNWSWHKCIWTVQAYLQLDVILTIIVFMIWRIVIFYCQWLSMKYMWQQENCGMLEQKLMSIFLSMEKKVTQDQDSCSNPRNPRNFWKDKWVKEHFLISLAGFSLSGGWLCKSN